MENDLISAIQLGFKQEDACINQLLSITHDVYQPLDQDSEVVGVCLGISKAFHKLWYKDFIHELELSGIG